MGMLAGKGAGQEHETTAAMTLWSASTETSRKLIGSSH